MVTIRHPLIADGRQPRLAYQSWQQNHDIIQWGFHPSDSLPSCPGVKITPTAPQDSQVITMGIVALEVACVTSRRRH
ncbi:hypothetical protein ASPCADRAFT_203396, partial [Aspergillus carbonarius ITEM 5010]